MHRLLLTSLFIWLTVIKNSHLVPNRHRTGKFFPYPFVSFPNEICRGDAENNWGICYTREQCQAAQGRRISSCSYGYGVCCLLESDGTSGPMVAVTRNLTTIRSPPANYLPRTSHFIFPRQRGVCQLRLDFERFQIAGANRNTSACSTDYMRITGSVTVVNLEICGQIAPNDHMYLDYGQGNQIEITINSMSSESNLGYRFRVMQIPCNSPRRVPQKCLQYFRNETGRVTSFNFPYQQLNNHRYTVCVEQRDPNALLQWSPCSMPTSTNVPANWRPFSITGRNEIVAPGQIVPPLPDPLPGPTTACGADFVEFYVSGKFCASNFVPITTPSYEMFVHFDGSEPTSRLNDLTMQCDIPPYPPTQAGYQPWVSADPVAAPGQGGNICVAKPLSTSIDVGNVGFCLMYSTVHRRI